MKEFCVYILKCSDESFYVGVTSKLDDRLNEHQMGKYPECYTASRLPVHLAFVRDYETANEAFRFEKQIKGWTRKKKEALINGDITKLKSLSICRNSTSHLKLTKSGSS